MATRRFDPNRLAFAACEARLKEAVQKTGAKVAGRIVTSRDPDAPRLRQALAIDNVPKGFTKWQLPVLLDGASFMFITIAEPNAKTPAHSHEEGDGIRFIAGGSIIYDGKELTAGDWMFIPKGQRYAFEAGPYGAIMCYCYRC
jgi:quercetin dioxygenase-like cupin family protein